MPLVNGVLHANRRHDCTNSGATEINITRTTLQEETTKRAPIMIRTAGKLVECEQLN